MFTLKACRRAYIVFGLMWTALVAVGILSSVPYFSNLKPDIITAPTVIFGPFFIWLSIFNLSVTETEISYRTLCGGTRTVNRHDVMHYKITIGEYMRLEDRTKPLVRLNIYTKNCQKKPALEINLKIFGYKSMQPFFDIMEADIAKNTL